MTYSKRFGSLDEAQAFLSARRAEGFGGYTARQPCSEWLVIWGWKS